MNTIPGSLTGHPDTDALVTEASQLVWAVRLDDVDQVAGVFAAATAKTGGDPLRAAHALALVLAAMCPDDLSPGDALTWCQDRDTYLRRREAGLSACAAADAIRIRRIPTEDRTA